MRPYYQDGLVTLWHGNCLQLAHATGCDVLVTDPPYGIGWQSGHFGTLPRSIAGDADTSLRDTMLDWWETRPALVFGSWRRPRPTPTRMLLVWDTKGALGMGDLSLPWKPAHQEIYVLGSGFVGNRDSDVLRFAPVQSMAANGRTHPHEKPVALMRALLAKCPADWKILDPFCGTGSTLVAAKSEGRHAVGIELEERYCEVAAQRLSQGVLDLGGVTESGFGLSHELNKFYGFDVDGAA
jgi:hypothetical protein